MFISTDNNKEVAYKQEKLSMKQTILEEEEESLVK